MNVWLFKAGENFPFQDNLRKMRTGMLAAQLVERGHQVTWWSTNFHHQTKTVLFPDAHEVRMGPNYTIKLLKGIPYKKNVSLKRWLNYKLVARRFRKAAQGMPMPDAIVTAMPSYDLAYEFVRLGQQLDIPVLVDVRDSWPDSFLDQLPSWARVFARLILFDDFRKLDYLLNNADAVLASSTGLLEWAFTHIRRDPGEYDRMICHGYPRPPENIDHGTLPEAMGKLVEHMQSKFTFTFVGTFGQAYDLEIVIEAARHFMNAQNPDVFFVLAGTGDQFERVKQAAEGITHIAVPGWLQGPQITALLRASSVGLATYKDVDYFFPNKAFEYLAHGLPILSSLPGELEQLLNEKNIGMTYRPGDLNQFCECVLKLSRNPELSKSASSNALQVFNERFEENQVYSDYVDHIERVAADKKDLRKRHTEDLFSSNSSEAMGTH